MMNDRYPVSRNTRTELHPEHEHPRAHNSVVKFYRSICDFFNMFEVMIYTVHLWKRDALLWKTRKFLTPGLSPGPTGLALHRASMEKGTLCYGGLASSSHPVSLQDPQASLYTVHLEEGRSVMESSQVPHTGSLPRTHRPRFTPCIWKRDALLWRARKFLTPGLSPGTHRPRFTPCIYGRGRSVMEDCQAPHTGISVCCVCVD